MSFKVLPDYALPNQHGKIVTSQEQIGLWQVYFFYPKDNTPGCTQEACSFRDQSKDFEVESAKIFGVSRDSVQSHLKFAEKQQLNFDLLSDAEDTFCKAMGVIKEKTMFAKTFLGIERSTFIVNPDNHIVKEWRKVNIKGHIDDVYQSLLDLKKNTK